MQMTLLFDEVSPPPWPPPLLKRSISVFASFLFSLISYIFHVSTAMFYLSLVKVLFFRIHGITRPFGSKEVVLIHSHPLQVAVKFCLCVRDFPPFVFFSLRLFVESDSPDSYCFFSKSDCVPIGHVTFLFAPSVIFFLTSLAFCSVAFSVFGC